MPCLLTKPTRKTLSHHIAKFAPKMAFLLDEKRLDTSDVDEVLNPKLEFQKLIETVVGHYSDLLRINSDLEHRNRDQKSVYRPQKAQDQELVVFVSDSPKAVRQRQREMRIVTKKQNQISNQKLQQLAPNTLTPLQKTSKSTLLPMANLKSTVSPSVVLKPCALNSLIRLRRSNQVALVQGQGSADNTRSSHATLMVGS